MVRTWTHPGVLYDCFSDVTDGSMEVLYVLRGANCLG